ncbi:helix-turn-helix domain-containing protein [Sphaerisporangium sp. TRM90804]|uniref:PucR family transcriptional regulator n=1 Tax=Sphaerisporangium sp. TRM90804 TaxID=3031113 RepID=UPI002447FFAD|nr:helix-turn-helix domain-containing protein [Sphaerisporangium sp. TRM90804]MDH2430754.1 helix-turn-helix domain-containing protein [Sphaerisporangium sp. TRM90804]
MPPTTSATRTIIERGARDAVTGERSWLRLLRPVEDSALSRAVTDPLVLDEVMARAGPGAAGWAVESGRRLRAELAQEPLISGNRRPGAESRFTEAVSLWAVLRLGGVRVIPGPVAAELTKVIRDRVPDGVSVELGLRCVRAAHALLTRALFQVCETTLPAGEQLATMRTISAELFDGMETLAAVVAEEFAVQRDRWFSGSAGERFELVNTILDGEPVDPEKAMRRLGYDLTLHHVALVLWRDALHDGTRELESVARRLLEQAGCSSVLLLPSGAGRLWAWGGRTSNRPTEFRRLDDAPVLPPHAHVASGLPDEGISGFRRSHAQALTAERVGRTAPPKPCRMYDYGALELMLLLSADTGAATEFVTRELGPLAADDKPMAALRDTVRCFLDQERSLAATAELLHIAKNTVVYRVQKAERLLGRSLREDRLRLHTALYLADQLGPVVLAGHGPGGPRATSGSSARQ